MRDSQRTKCYRAEIATRRALKLENWSTDSIWRLASESWKVRQTHEDQPMPAIVVNRRLSQTSRFRWSSSGRTMASEIELAPTMLDPITVMHELTHAEMLPTLIEKSSAPHGPLFMLKLLTSLGRTLGPAVEHEYRFRCDQYGVKIARRVG